MQFEIRLFKPFELIDFEIPFRRMEEFGMRQTVPWAYCRIIGIFQYMDVRGGHITLGQDENRLPGYCVAGKIRYDYRVAGVARPGLSSPDENIANIDIGSVVEFCELVAT